MNTKHKITAVKKICIFIFLLSFAWTNLCAENAIFGHEYENKALTETRPNMFSDDTGFTYMPFDSKAFSDFSVQLQMAGDRPGPGDGIGVVSIHDGQFLLLFFAMIYGLYARYRHTRIEKK